MVQKIFQFGVGHGCLRFHFRGRRIRPGGQVVRDKQLCRGGKRLGEAERGRVEETHGREAFDGGRLRAQETEVAEVGAAGGREVPVERDRALAEAARAQKLLEGGVHFFQLRPEGLPGAAQAGDPTVGGGVGGGMAEDDRGLVQARVVGGGDAVEVVDGPSATLAVVAGFEVFNPRSVESRHGFLNPHTSKLLEMQLAERESLPGKPERGFPAPLPWWPCGRLNFCQP